MRARALAISFLARGAPGEEQVRDVHTGDEEHEADGAHHEPEAEAGLLGKKVVFEEARLVTVGSRICFWVGLRELSEAMTAIPDRWRLS